MPSRGGRAAQDGLLFAAGARGGEVVSYLDAPGEDCSWLSLNFNSRHRSRYTLKSGNRSSTSLASLIQSAR
jgi:hypothetical protein